MTLQLLGNGQELLAVLVTDHNGGGAEDLLRQVRVLLQIFVIRDKSEACTVAASQPAGGSSPCARTVASRPLTAAVYRSAMALVSKVCGGVVFIRSPSSFIKPGVPPTEEPTPGLAWCKTDRHRG